MESSLALVAVLAGLPVLALAGLALWVGREARRAESRFPPSGRFLEVDGVRLHCHERGLGPPVLLIHGNASLGQDFEACGLIDELAARYRVIAIDRPGFGYSTRPRGRAWSPRRQAALLIRACAALDAPGPLLVVAHSQGVQVALEMALAAGGPVRGLVLVSGYYYPTPRLDAWILGLAAVPVVGDLLCYTLLPIAGWLMMPRLLRRLFAPRPVARGFVSGVAPLLLVRPAQLRACAADSALLVPAAVSLSRRYAHVRQPVEIFAGAGDRLVRRQHSRQSGRLHASLPRSELHMMPGMGHMLHHGLAHRLASAVDRIAAVERIEPMVWPELANRKPLRPRPGAGRAATAA